MLRLLEVAIHRNVSACGLATDGVITQESSLLGQSDTGAFSHITAYLYMNTEARDVILLLSLGLQQAPWTK